MALLPILKFPDKRLRIKAKKIKTFDDNLKKLIDDMFETMYHASGIGLAATQVDRHIQLIVMNVDKDRKQPICLINPEIIEKSGEEESEEGCLSVPNYYANVKRASDIKIKALDKNAKEFILNASGVLAICIQHEIDHLQGVLFVDYLSRLKRERLKKKFAL